MALFSLIFSACAGNPPDWWNPSGMYGNEGEKTASQPAVRVQPSLSMQTTAEEEEPAEQSIDPAFEAYEEMRLSPLSATEDEIIETETEEKPELSLTQESSPENSPTALPETSSDNFLPPPSVLE